MDLDRLLEEYALNDLEPVRLWEIGVAALVAGFDSRSLRMLAGAEREEASTQRNLVAKAFDEIGLAIPTEAEVVLRRAKRIATDVLAGTTSPYEGASRIGSLYFATGVTVATIRVFMDLADEADADWRHRAEYEAAIFEACRQFLGDSGS